MIPVENISYINKKQAVERLTALWALNEAGLGGFLHAFRSPFTGIIVGGISVILLVMISYFSEFRVSVLLKSLVLVLIVKAMVSPYSPLPAYFAVSFQAIITLIIFSIIRNIKIASLFIAVFSMLESALQKVALLTILFGHTFWKAIDNFAQSIFHQLGWLSVSNDLHLSGWIIGFYLFIYLSFGILIGIYAGILPNRILKVISADTRFIDQQKIQQILASKILAKSKKSSKKRLLLFLFLPTLLLIFYALKFENNWIQSVQLLARSILILLLWYLIIGPFLMKILKQFLTKKRSEYFTEVEQTLALFPALKKLTALCWEETTSRKGYKRWYLFMENLIAYTLLYKSISADENPITHTE